jgi:mono/diheme cytochrome c family protein
MAISLSRRILILSFLAVLLSACSFSLAEDITPPPGSVQQPVQTMQPEPVSGPLYPLVPPDPIRGEAIYAEKCAPCHGTGGLGDGERAAQLPNPVPALGSSQVARQAIPAQWYAMVTQGNLERFMPPFTSLSNGERWDVVAYALSLSAPPDLVEQGDALFQENCAGCHGERAQGDGPEAASLTAAPKDLTNQELMAGKSAADLFAAISQGAPPDMPAFEDQLSEDERWVLASYLRNLTFSRSQGEQAAAPTPMLQVTTPMSETVTAASGTPVAAAEEPTSSAGTVTGSVVNLSNQPVPEGLEVILRGYDNMTPVITQTTTLQTDGKYAFENVEMPTGRAFMVLVDYKGTQYGSDIALAQPGDPSLELPIAIYETSSDSSQLKADRLHVFLEFVDEKTLRVIELYIISNPTNTTIVPPEEGQPTLAFDLPEGATNLQFQDGVLGGRYVETEGGFGDTAPIRPGSGSYELLFGYELPYDRKLDLSHPVPIPADAVVILSPENGVKIRGESLVDAGTRDVQGAQYRLYNGESLPAGGDLSLSVSGQPSGGGSVSITPGNSTNLIIGLTVFGVALVVAGVWLFLRSRKAEAEATEPEEEVVEETGSTSDNPDALMDAIIALDDLYQAGELPETAYQERRAKLKRRLQEVLGEAG